MRLRALFAAAVLILFTAGRAAPQAVPFNILATENGISVTVPNTSTINVNSALGAGVTVDIKATYIGNVQATIAQPATLVGSTSFSVTTGGTLPLVLNQGDSVTMHVIYRPTNSSGATAQVTLLFTQPSTSSGGGPTTQQGAIVLTFQGTAPQFQLSYVLQSTGNAVSLPASGGTLLFPGTPINTTAQANLDISNTGSGPGQITAITLPKGPQFKVQGLPPFPVTVGSNQTLPLVVTYTPTAVETDNDQIQITYQAGNTVTVSLEGSGTSAGFTYNLIQGGKSTPVKPNSTISLPDTNVGDTGSLIVQVQNTGNASGTVNSVSISGQAFSLGSALVFPEVLKPGDNFSFSINFLPTQAGTAQGEMVIGSDLFTLTGKGLGPKLSFSYISSAGTTTLPPATAVVFSPIAVGQSEKVTFVVTNAGTSTATVSNIGINGTNSPYSIKGLSPLPLSLLPGQSSQFTIIYTPATTGFTNGSLVLDTTNVPLVGSGTAPPALPSYAIQGPSGNTSPLTQAPVTLTLSNSYPLDLTGTLTLTTSGDFGSDQTVQFETGGVTVNFTIPANATSANFAGQGPQVLLQTGTVAQTVTLTPSFATAAGGVNLTPGSPTTLQFTILPQTPVVLSLQSTNQTTNGFTLLVTGYATTRSLTTVNVTFTAAPGYHISSAPVPVDVSQVATTWFQGSTSHAFGGQFEITIPFTLQGPTPPVGKTLLQSIASVSATVTNGLGTSNSLQTAVQ